MDLLVYPHHAVQPGTAMTAHDDEVVRRCGTGPPIEQASCPPPSCEFA